MFVTLQKLALSLLQLNSISFNSQQEVQTNGCFSSKYKSKMAEFPSTTMLNATEVEMCQQCYQVCFLFCFCVNGVKLRAGYIQIKCWNVNIMSVTSFFLLLILHWCCGFVPSCCLVHDLTSLTYNQQTATILTDGARGATLYHIMNRKLFAIIDLFCAVLIYFNGV